MGLTTFTTIDAVSHDGYARATPPMMRARAIASDRFFMHASARNHRMYLCSPWIPPGQKAFKESGHEGFVDNLDETLEAHRRCTVTTYGTRTSKKPAGTISHSEHDKENNSNVANKQVKTHNT